MAQRVSVQRQRIGPAIRKLRRQNDLTLDDLASQAGISASHLSRLERGQTLPSFTVLAQIAHVLGASVDEFVQLEQDVTALDREFGGSLEQLGFSGEARRELLDSSIELRRELVDALRALSMPPGTTMQKQDEAVRAVMEQGLTGASAALNRVVRSGGLSGVGFARALYWQLTTPGELRMLVAEPGLIGYDDDDFMGVYRSVAGDEPIDLHVPAWWATGAAAREERPTRALVQRDVLSRYYRTGAWMKGAQGPKQRVQDSAERLASRVREGVVQLAITDVPLGEINMLISEDGDTLLESARYRATGDDHARLGIVVRGRSASATFVQRFDQLWAELPSADKDPATVAGWVREHAAAVGAGHA